ncbi:Intraflagellar transport protein 46 like [Pseudolycoriella hygida]|uniref:Intraflagellar transport protein 46 homolog n=1 Tax=Pseudolycoriella hygida TaxID=35572 RepID=A0A9Q0N8N5_9DIPT|nr:Intraflagellar transport protein 46 like [Pseudolycoriella hygida]
MEYYDEVVEIEDRSNNGKKMIESSVDDKSLMGDLKQNKLIESGPQSRRPTSSLNRNRPPHDVDNFGSDSDTSESDRQDSKQFITDHREWDKLDVPLDIKEIFQYILRYSPQKIEIDYVLQPFIPESVPAVGDIDAFLKVLPPKPLVDKPNVLSHIEKLGLEILDEPSGQQSDPALLHMKLRSVSTQPRAPAPPSAVVWKSQKDIDKWIAEVQMLHVNQPFPQIIHKRPVQDIDKLMTEWPPKMERMLNQLGFPSAYLNCSLKFYIELVCGIFDIPIAATKTQSDYIYALYTFFNLYMAVKSSVG